MTGEIAREITIERWASKGGRDAHAESVRPRRMPLNERARGDIDDHFSAGVPALKAPVFVSAKGFDQPIRRCHAHHIFLRLPTGIFYGQGVKANVLFFDLKPAADKKAWTEKLWIYDLRTDQHFTLKENTLKRRHLDDFVASHNPKNRHARKETEQFNKFTYDELIKRDKVNLNIFWLKDDALEASANLPAPGTIAGDIVEDLRAALEQFAAIEGGLKYSNPLYGHPQLSENLPTVPSTALRRDGLRNAQNSRTHGATFLAHRCGKVGT